MKNNIIRHLEKYLGKIESGYSSKEKKNLQVGTFLNMPEDGIVTYSTIGISNHLLKTKNDKEIKVELVLSLKEDVPTAEAVSFLISLSEHLLERHIVPLRGDVLGPSSPIFSNSSLNSVYFSVPFCFDDEFDVFVDNFSNIVMIQILPIFEEECNYIKKYGWEKFEDLLGESNLNLMDTRRKQLYF